MTTYQSAGVDLDLGTQASQILYRAAKQTWLNRKGKLGDVIVPFDDFSGLRAIDVSCLPAGTLMNVGFDGVGTKVEVAERVDDHSTIAFDLFAMVCDDAVIRGAEPVLLGSILDVNRLSEGGENLQRVQQLADGYVAAAHVAGVAVVNGEVAEMGNRVGGFGSFHYNWGSAVVWFAHKERIITGHEVRPGDAVVGLSERGFRSNGLSLVRKVLSSSYGDDWHHRSFQGTTLGQHVLQPSQIYTGAVVDMTGGLEGTPKVRIHAAAHITGGGIPEKLGRALRPSGLGASLHNLLEPSAVMRHCQKLGDITEREAYRTWNMGQGMLLVTPEPERAIAVAQEHGISAQVVGEVTAEPEIKIWSRGLRSKEIVF